MQELVKEINDYWSHRAVSYSEVNQTELAGCQHGLWKKELEKKLREVFKSASLQELSVLDIGTGPGFFAILLAELGCKVTAVDANEAMLQQARRNAGALAKKIIFAQMGAQRLNFATGSFDVVISRNLTWVLTDPGRAYGEWCRVLKKGGLLLNFDANWYGYLYDEEKRRAYEKDREEVEAQGMEDHFIGTDIEAMEKIALAVPLSTEQRPAWDEKILSVCGMQKIKFDFSINERLLSDTERVNYASTPYFGIAAVK